MSTNTNIIEKNILVNIDNLVKVIIKMSQSEKENFNAYLPEVENLFIKTNSLLCQLLAREEIPFEQIYRQLIAQRLPHSESQKCFGNLEPVLEAIFALSIFHNHVQKQPPTDTIKATAPPILTKKSNLSKKPKVNLDKFIATLYPKEKILKNYYLRSIKLDYFLPNRKLAVILTPRYYRRSISLDLLILREGLHLIEISPRILNNPHLLYQKFPRLSSFPTNLNSIPLF